MAWLNHVDHQDGYPRGGPRAHDERDPQERHPQAHVLDSFGVREIYTASKYEGRVMK